MFMKSILDLKNILKKFKGVVNMRTNIKVYLTNGQLNFNTKDDLREWYKSKSDDSNILYIVDSVNKEIKNLVF